MEHNQNQQQVTVYRKEKTNSNFNVNDNNQNKNKKNFKDQEIRKSSNIHNMIKSETTQFMVARNGIKSQEN